MTTALLIITAVLAATFAAIVLAPVRGAAWIGRHAADQQRDGRDGMRSERSAVTPLLVAALLIGQAIAAAMTWGWFG